MKTTVYNRTDDFFGGGNGLGVCVGGLGGGVDYLRSSELLCLTSTIAREFRYDDNHTCTSASS